MDSIESMRVEGTDQMRSLNGAQEDPIPLRRRPMTTMVYKSKFAQLVQKLKKRTGTFEYAKVVDQLKTLEEMVRVDTFEYTSVKEEREGKRSLLMLWEQLMELADIVPAYRQNLFYSMIFYIVTRYEFDLIHITKSLSTRSRSLFKSKKKLSIHAMAMTDSSTLKPDKAHLEIFKNYRRLLVIQTERVLDHFSQKSMSKVLRKFCSQILSVSYFRIPILSGSIMSACCSYENQEDRSELGKWTKSRTKDWVKQFAEHIYGEFDSLVHESTGIQIGNKNATSDFFSCNPTIFQWTLLMENDDRDLLEKTKCLSKLSNDRFFFKFISRLIAHVNDVLHSVTDDATFKMYQQQFTKSSRIDLEADEDLELHFTADRSVRWGIIPGYWSMVKAVLDRSMIPLTSYRADLKKCVLRLLANPDLLGLFTKLYLRSTSVTRKHEVNACIDLIDAAFDAACGTSLSAPLPDSFCFDEFFKAIDVLLSSDQFEVLLKTLCLIYTHSGRFYGEHRFALLQDLLVHKYFFKFFVHWYPAVRRQFHHILAYKLDRKGLATEIGDMDEDHKTNKASWFRKVGKQFSRMFSDADSPSQRRYSPVFEAGIDSESVNEGGDILKRQEEVKKELIKDPPVDSCEVITTKLSTDEMMQDEVIANNLQLYIHMLETQEHGNVDRFIHPSTAVYVPSALRQYREIQTSMENLQRQKHLHKFQVLVPSMYYDIPADSKEID